MSARLLLVTGGSRGLGAALCRHYRDEGWKTVDFSRSGTGDGHVALDLAAPMQAAASLEEALQPLAARRWDDVLAISNAARLGPVGPLATKADQDIIANLEVNVAGGIVFMNAVLRAFATHKARKVLVNISSGAAARPVHGWSLYCASKAGLERFVECLAVEQAALPQPFTAISIQPGILDTAMQAELRASDPDDFPDRNTFIGFQRDGALRAPGEVAQAIAGIVAGPLEGGAVYRVAASTG